MKGKAKSSCSWDSEEWGEKDVIYKQDPFHRCATGAPLLQCLHPKLECRLLNRMTTYLAQSPGFFLQHSTPVNTALGQWRQEDQPLWVILNLEFEASLGYTKPSSKMLTVGAWVLPFLEKVKLKPSDVNHSGIFSIFLSPWWTLKGAKHFLFFAFFRQCLSIKPTSSSWSFVTHSISSEKALSWF